MKKAEQGTQAIRTGGRSVPPLSGPLFLVDVDGLGNMPSNRRADPRQIGKTLPDRLLCAVICGDIHTRSDSGAQAMGFFPMPESVTGTNSRMIGGTQVERPLEDLPSLCRAKAAPTMRVIIGEPPAKDMGCKAAAAVCGDSPERRAHIRNPTHPGAIDGPVRGK